MPSKFKPLEFMFYRLIFPIGTCVSIINFYSGIFLYRNRTFFDKNHICQFLIPGLFIYANNTRLLSNARHVHKYIFAIFYSCPPCWDLIIIKLYGTERLKRPKRVYNLYTKMREFRDNIIFQKYQIRINLKIILKVFSICWHNLYPVYAKNCVSDGGQ